MKNNRKGFTTVELVIVIAVIAILAAVLIPTFANLISKANQSAALQEVRAAYSELVADLDYANGETAPEKIYVTFGTGESAYWVVCDNGQCSIVTGTEPTDATEYTLTDGVLAVAEEVEEEEAPAA